MQKLKRTGTILLTVLGLLVMSGLAMAATDDDKNDTVFNYGYDVDEQFLIWNVSSLDYEPNYGALFEELYSECSLDTQTFSYIVGDLGLELTEAGPAEEGSSEPVPTDQLECGPFVGGYVTGPNGQINHGQFMKLFNSMYDGPRRGCISRHLAHSLLGKNDQKLTVREAAELNPPYQPDGLGEVTFSSEVADCLNKKAQNGEDGPGNSAAGKAKKADKWPDGKPGKSGNAPGRNK